MTRTLKDYVGHDEDCEVDPDRGMLCSCGLDALIAAVRAEAEQQIAEAIEALQPNMPTSGLVDACRQVKQVAISEADNAEKAEHCIQQQAQAIQTLRAALVNLLSSHSHEIGPCLCAAHEAARAALKDAPS